MYVFCQHHFSLQTKVLLETSDTPHGYPLNPVSLHVLSVFLLAQGLPKNQGSNKAPLSWLMSSLQHSHQQGGLTLALLMKGFKT